MYESSGKVSETPSGLTVTTEASEVLNIAANDEETMARIGHVERFDPSLGSWSAYEERRTSFLYANR